jgi:hypothetical protein
MHKVEPVTKQQMITAFESEFALLDLLKIILKWIMKR